MPGDHDHQLARYAAFTGQLEALTPTTGPTTTSNTPVCESPYHRTKSGEADVKATLGSPTCGPDTRTCRPNTFPTAARQP